MTTGATVRSACRQDLDSLVRLCADVHEIHVRQFPWRFHSMDLPAAREKLESWRVDPGYRCLVAESDGQVVGYILLIIRHYAENAFCHARHFLYIDQIGVEPSRRGRGVGSKLMDAAKKLARDEGMDCLELSVWAFNETARGFFSRHGFDVAREHRICRLS